MRYKIDGVQHDEEFNTRNMKLFTCRWIPINQDPKALMLLCHGYALECSISMKGVGHRLAKAGFTVYGMDYEGHGKSEGLQGFIPFMDDLVKDCSDHYTRICEKEENTKKMRVIMGESLGSARSAVALRLHRLKPEFWDGAILVAPMCKITDELRLNAVVSKALSKLCYVIPKWKIVPIQDITDVAFRNPDVRKEIKANPYCYKGRPRLLTANQLLVTSLHLQKKLDEIEIPFIVLHGEEDKLVDPSVSKLLYESAKSKDKTFKLYPGMWHSLSFGELPENLAIVFTDILSWLNDRVALRNATLETENSEKKVKHDELARVVQAND